MKETVGLHRKKLKRRTATGLLQRGEETTEEGAGEDTEECCCLVWEIKFGLVNLGKNDCFKWEN